MKSVFPILLILLSVSASAADSESANCTLTISNSQGEWNYSLDLKKLAGNGSRSFKYDAGLLSRDHEASVGVTGPALDGRYQVSLASNPTGAAEQTFGIATTRVAGLKQTSLSLYAADRANLELRCN
jgi:hypothetical protein